jgi:hypothetical protein
LRSRSRGGRPPRRKSVADSFPSTRGSGAREGPQGRGGSSPRNRGFTLRRPSGAGSPG